MDADLETPVADINSWSTTCLNCGAPLSGAFCSHCGQRALPPHPTTRELAGDAYNELVGWDGKVADTMRLLLRHPGELTRRLLDGQRQRFISPVRLYLTCSVLYFLVVAAAPPPDVEAFDISFGIGAADAQTVGEKAFGKAISEGFQRLTPSERAELDREIASKPRVVQPLLRTLATDYPAVQKRISETMPKALFILVPVLGLILGLFYRGRHFPEHLYFAIHFQAFVFLVLTIVGLTQYSRLVIAMLAAQSLGALVIVGYGVVAQRRVYGGTWLATALKAVGIGIVYGTAWSLTTLVVTMLASL